MLMLAPLQAKGRIPLRIGDEGSMTGGGGDYDAGRRSDSCSSTLQKLRVVASLGLLNAYRVSIISPLNSKFQSSNFHTCINFNSGSCPILKRTVVPIEKCDNPRTLLAHPDEHEVNSPYPTSSSAPGQVPNFCFRKSLL